MKIKLYDPTKINITLNSSEENIQTDDNFSLKKCYYDLNTSTEKYQYFMNLLSDLFADPKETKSSTTMMRCVSSAAKNDVSDIFENYDKNFVDFKYCFDEVAQHLKRLMTTTTTTTQEANSDLQLSNWQKLLHISHVQKEYENLIQCYYEYLSAEEQIEFAFYTNVFLGIKNTIIRLLTETKAHFEHQTQRIMAFRDERLAAGQRQTSDKDDGEKRYRIKDVVETETTNVLRELHRMQKEKIDEARDYYVGNVFVSLFKTEFLDKSSANYQLYLDRTEKATENIKKYKYIIFHNNPDIFLNNKFIKIDKCCEQILEMIRSNFAKNKKNIFLRQQQQQ